MLRKLFLGTKNPAKLKEYKKYFQLFSPQLKLLTSFDLKIKGDPQETGKTFTENAILKAKFYAQKSGLTTLADDGGLEIKALNNKPGIHSRRWPGYEASDQELVSLVFEKMKNIPQRKRQAHLKAVVVIVSPQGKIICQEEEKTKGIIPQKPSSWVKGFPYRAVLYFPQFKKFYQDLTDKEHKLINHRRKIVKRISRLLPKISEANHL